MLLAGDVGGTKVVLALFEDAKKRVALKEEKFVSRDFQNFQEIVKAFIPKEQSIEKACFGIAGPILNNTCKATNLPWTIDGDSLKTLLGAKSVRLINDLEANAWGISALKEEEFYILNEGKKQLGHKALISAGTGLGEAGIYFDGKIDLPFPTEGGHCGFSPEDEEDIALWRYLKTRYDHISFERLLSGHGIENIYRFFVESQKEKEILEVKERIQKEDPAQVISECALSKKCPTCVKTLDKFVTIYGIEAGNLALKFLALGGLYIGGGIAPKILQTLENGLFMKSFVSKGRFQSILSQIPVKVILNPKTALLGAAVFADRI